MRSQTTRSLYKIPYAFLFTSNELLETNWNFRLQKRTPTGQEGIARSRPGCPLRTRKRTKHRAFDIGSSSWGMVRKLPAGPLRWGVLRRGLQWLHGLNPSAGRPCVLSDPPSQPGFLTTAGEDGPPEDREGRARMGEVWASREGVVQWQHDPGVGGCYVIDQVVLQVPSHLPDLLTKPFSAQAQGS